MVFYSFTTKRFYFGDIYYCGVAYPIEAFFDIEFYNPFLYSIGI